MSRKSDRDLLLLLLLFVWGSRRSAGRQAPWTPPNPLPPGPPPPFPPPGMVPSEPQTPEPSLLESFQRAIEETFKGTPIELEWWREQYRRWQNSR